MTIVLTVYFVYGIIGVSIFRDVTFSYNESGINDWANFKDLPTALITLFRVSTFDDWTYLAQDYSGYYCPKDTPGINCGNPWFLVYFISFILLQTYMILNLLLAVLIENFTDRATDQKVTRLAEFTTLRNFWNTLDDNASGFIPVTALTDLLLNLGEPLGFHGSILQKDIIEEYSKMKISIYNDNQVNFFDLLRGITRRSLKLDLTAITHFEVPVAQGRTVADYYREKVDYFQNLTAEQKNNLPEDLRKKYKEDKFFDQYTSLHKETELKDEREGKVIDSNDISVEIDDEDDDEDDQSQNTKINYSDISVNARSDSNSSNSPRKDIEDNNSVSDSHQMATLQEPEL